MSVKTRIGLVDQLAVKPLFADARLASGYQKNSLAVWVESEGHTPGTVSGIKP